MKLELDINSLQNTLVSADIHTTDTGSSDEVKKMLRSGIKLAKEGSRAEARQMLLSVTKAEPSNETAWLWLASISEYPEELLIFLQNVLKVNPNNERANEWAKQTKSLLSKTFVQRGITASQDNQKEFAKQCFLQGIVHDDENEMAWLWLASSSDSQEEKVSHLQKVLQINPNNETALNSLNSVRNQVSQSVLKKASSAAIAGDHESARQLLESIMKNTPNLEEAWILKAFLANDFYEKIDCYEKTLEINPNNEAAQAGLASLRSLAPKAKSNNHTNSHQPTESIAVSEPTVETPVQEVEAPVEENAVNEELFAQENVVSEETANEEMLVQEDAEETVVNEEVLSFQESAVETSDEILVAEESQENLLVEESPKEFVAYETVETTENQLNEVAHFTDEEVEAEHQAMQDSFADDEPLQQQEVFETASLTENEATEQMQEEVADNVAELQAETENEVAQEFQSVENNEVQASVSEPVQNNYFESETQHSFADYIDSPTQELDEEVAQKAEESFQPVAQEEVLAEANAQHSFENEVSTNGFQPFEAETFADEVAEMTTEHQETFAPAETEDFAYTEETSQVEFASQPVESNYYDSNEPAEEVFADAQQPTVEFAHSEFPAIAEQSFTNSAEVENENVAEEFETVEHNQDFSQDYSVAPAESFADDEQIVVEQVAESAPIATQLQWSLCPFCQAENEVQTVVCQNCHAMLSLADLDALLTHHDTNQDLIKQGIERLEAQKNSRNLSSEELQNLGVAHLNIKNLRQGLAYLQSASQMNPNDVFLSSKVNFLATRLAEIDQNDHKVNVGKPNQSRTVLVVDDSPTVRKLISGKLEKCGHTVLSAVDGMDALAKINEIIPDLILLDITMPRLDGYQVCKLIRNNEVTKEVPIVMISGKDGFFDKVRGRMAGSSGYITKPFGPDTLMKTIETFLN